MFGHLLRTTLLSLFGAFCLMSVVQAEELDVKITSDIPYVNVSHEGKTVRIQRIQDTSNKLANSFTKTSRPCPPFCVHPMNIAPGVTTVGELEVLDFLKNDVSANHGLLVDARMPDWYEKGTIPGSVNIPFTILSEGLDNPHTSRILRLLGASENQGEWDFANARDLMLFCNGLWCDQSPRAIKNLISLGYPSGKLFWYRAGMQSWQQLGLTTVIPGE